jgi:hypothetical protein
LDITYIVMVVADSSRRSTADWPPTAPSTHSLRNLSKSVLTMRLLVRERESPRAPSVSQTDWLSNPLTVQVVLLQAAGTTQVPGVPAYLRSIPVLIDTCAHASCAGTAGCRPQVPRKLRRLAGTCAGTCGTSWLPPSPQAAAASSRAAPNCVNCKYKIAIFDLP